MKVPIAEPEVTQKTGNVPSLPNVSLRNPTAFGVGVAKAQQGIAKAIGGATKTLAAVIQKKQKEESEAADARLLSEFKNKAHGRLYSPEMETRTDANGNEYQVESGLILRSGKNSAGSSKEYQDWYSQIQQSVLDQANDKESLYLKMDAHNRTMSAKVGVREVTQSKIARDNAHKNIVGQNLVDAPKILSGREFDTAYNEVTDSQSTLYPNQPEKVEDAVNSLAEGAVAGAMLRDGSGFEAKELVKRMKGKIKPLKIKELNEDIEKDAKSILDQKTRKVKTMQYVSGAEIIGKVATGEMNLLLDTKTVEDMAVRGEISDTLFIALDEAKNNPISGYDQTDDDTAFMKAAKIFLQDDDLDNRERNLAEMVKKFTNKQGKGKRYMQLLAQVAIELGTGIEAGQQPKDNLKLALDATWGWGDELEISEAEQASMTAAAMELASQGLPAQEIIEQTKQFELMRQGASYDKEVVFAKHIYESLMYDVNMTKPIYRYLLLGGVEREEAAETAVEIGRAQSTGDKFKLLEEIEKRFPSLRTRLPEDVVEELDKLVAEQKDYEEGFSPVASLDVIGEVVRRVPLQIAATALSASQSFQGASAVNPDWADKIIAKANKNNEGFVRDMKMLYRNKKIVPFIPITLTQGAESAQAFGYSLTSMGAGVVAALPLALVPEPTGATKAAAWTLGTATSGAVAYRASAYQIMQTYLEAKNEESKEKHGRPMTIAEEEKYRDVFARDAAKYGLVEASFEMVGNAVLGGVFLGKLTKIAGKSVVKRMMVGLLEVYGTELTTEGATSYVQSRIEAKHGLREEGLSWWQSLKEVAPQVFILSTVLGGASSIAGSKSSTDTTAETKTKLKEAIDNDTSLTDAQKEDLKNKVETEIDENRPFKEQVDEQAKEHNQEEIDKANDAINEMEEETDPETGYPAGTVLDPKTGKPLSETEPINVREKVAAEETKKAEGILKKNGVKDVVVKLFNELKTKEGKKAGGFADSKKGEIGISNKDANENTGFHEAMHIIFNRVLETSEIKALVDEFSKKKYQDKYKDKDGNVAPVTEILAEEFAEYANNREGSKVKGKLKTILEKMYNNLVSRISSTTGKKVFADVYEGKTDRSKKGTAQNKATQQKLDMLLEKSFNEELTEEEKDFIAENRSREFQTADLEEAEKNLATFREQLAEKIKNKIKSQPDKFFRGEDEVETLIDDIFDNETDTQDPFDYGLISKADIKKLRSLQKKVDAIYRTDDKEFQTVDPELTSLNSYKNTSQYKNDKSHKKMIDDLITQRKKELKAFEEADREFQRVNPEWTSKMQQVIMEKMGKRMPAQQLKRMLLNNGVKPAEMKAYDMDNYLELWEDDGVSKEDILNFIDEGRIEIKDVIRRGEPKYADWQIDGGTNYKETLLTVPNDNTDSRTDREQLGGDPKVYRSTHWSEPNILAHIRTNDRTIDGKKILFIEEIQSDWAKDGRDKGFKQELTAAEQSRFNELTRKERRTNRGALAYLGTPAEFEANKLTEAELVELEILDAKDKSKIPYNPLLKKWQELALKKVVRMASEGNYDGISWITGEQTAERYRLDKHVKEISWYVDTQNAGQKTVRIDLQSGSVMRFGVSEDGIISKDETSSTPVPAELDGKKIDEVVGKDIAKQIMDEELGGVEGEGLRMNKEWTRNLYDRQVPNILKKLTKGKVEMVDLGSKKGFSDQDIAELVASAGITRDQAIESLEEEIGKETGQQQMIPLSNKVKERVMAEGQPEFQTLYHGHSQEKDFNKYDMKNHSGGIFFAKDKEYAKGYSDQGGVSKVDLDSKKPLDLTKIKPEKTIPQWKAYFKSKGITNIKFDTSLTETNAENRLVGFKDNNGNWKVAFHELIGANDYWEADGNIVERLQEAGYDSIETLEGGGTTIIFDPAMIRNQTIEFQVLEGSGAVGKPNTNRNLEKEVAKKITEQGAKISDDKLKKIREQNLLDPETIDEIISRKRGIITDKEAVERASKMKGTVDDLLKIPKGTVPNKEQMTAIAQIVQETREVNQRLVDLIENGGQSSTRAERALIEEISDGKTLTEEEALQQALEANTIKLRKAEIVLFAAKSEAGRALQGAKQVIQAVDSRMRIAFNKIKRLPMLERQAMIEDLANRNLDDNQEFMKFLDEVNTADNWDKLAEWITAIKLWNPTTHAVNFGGNLLRQLVDMGIMSVANPKLAKADLMGAISGFKQGLKNARRALTDEGYAVQQSKFIESGGSAPAIKGTLGKIVRQPFSWLGAGDAVYRAMAFQRSLYRQAAQMTNNNATEMEKILKRPTEDMVKKATALADTMTFQEDMGKIGQWINKGRTPANFDTFAEKFGATLLKAHVLFLKTPINLAKQALDFSPVSVLKNNKKFREALAKGDADTVQRIAGEAVFGSLVMLGVAAMTLAGNVTGGAPRKEAERDQFYREKKVPYAIKVFGKWYQYKRVDPLSTVVALTADSIELGKKGEFTPGAVLTLIGDNLKDKTFLRGLADLSDLLTGEPWEKERAAQSLIIGNIIPSIVGHAARTIDPKVRAVDKNASFKQKLIQRAMTQIPVMSKMLPARVNVLGTEISRASQGLNYFFNPIQSAVAEIDPVTQELAEMGYSIPLPSPTFSSNKVKYKLTAVEYHAFATYVGTKLTEYITYNIGTRSYERRDNDDKIKGLEKARREIQNEWKEAYLDKKNKRRTK